MVKKKSAPRRRKKGLVIELTPFSSLLWTIGLLFVMAWVFGLGIFIGRGYLPEKVTAVSDMKTRIKRIQNMVSRDEPVKETEKGKKEEDPELVFYERLSNKKDEVKKQWPERRDDRIPAKQTPPAVRGDLSSPRNHSGTEPVTKTMVEEKPRVSAVRTYFTIQLASLREADAAEAMVERLNRQGYTAYYYEAEVRGQTYYRVRSGRFSVREEAEAYAQRLARKEGLKGFVTTLE